MICSGHSPTAEKKKNSGSLIASADVKVLYLQTLQSFSKKQMEAWVHFIVFCKKNESVDSFIPREQYSNQIRFKSCQQ